MKITTRNKWIAISITLFMLLLDQTFKILVKTNMYYHDSIHITNWFYIHFIENDGMAFGWQIFPKITQTVSRIIFSFIIIWYIKKIIIAKFNTGFIISVCLILAGALGNIFDSIFYGAIFSESTFSTISTFVPIGNGYSDWLRGKVVDMFYFPLFEFNWPKWIPIIGGNNFIFFSPVFNLADAFITCGILLIFLFYFKSLEKSYNLIIEEIQKYPLYKKLKNK